MSKATELVTLSEQLISGKITTEQFRLRVSHIILNLTKCECLALAKIFTTLHQLPQ